MKKIVILISAILVVTTLLTVAIFSINSMNEDEPTKIDVFETLTADAESESGVYSMKKLNYRDIFTDFSQENVDTILKAFDVIIEKNDYIEFPDTRKNYGIFMLDRLLKFDHGEIKDGKFIVDTDADKTDLKLSMYVSVFIENFPEYITTNYLGDDPNSYSSRGTLQFYISTEYTDHGYPDINSYLKDCRKGVAEYGESTYRINVYDIDMYLVKDEYPWEPPFNPNLFSSINPKDIWDVRYPCVVTTEAE